jgi:hypothetical protein
VHVYEKSKCIIKNLDEEGTWWCNTHKDSSSIGQWSPEFKGGQKEALWFGNNSYSFAFVPEGEVINTFLKLAEISVSQ